MAMPPFINSAELKAPHLAGRNPMKPSDLWVRLHLRGNRWRVLTIQTRKPGRPFSRSAASLAALRLEKRPKTVGPLPDIRAPLAPEADKFAFISKMTGWRAPVTLSRL